MIYIYMYIYMYIYISALFQPLSSHIFSISGKSTHHSTFFLVRPGHDSHSKSLSPQMISECDASVPVEWNIHRMKYTDYIVNIIH